MYRDCDPARGSRPALVLDTDPCPSFHLNRDLERGAHCRALPGISVDVTFPWRAPSTGGLSRYDLDLAGRHWPGNLARAGADRQPPPYFRATRSFQPGNPA